MKKIFYIGLLLSLFSCDKMDYGFRIINLTKDTIIFNYLTNDNIASEIQFYIPKKYNRSYLIPPNDTIVVGNPVDWEEYIKACENSQLVLYVFKKTDLDKVPWDIIKGNSCYYKMYRITNYQLDSLNGIFKILR